MSPIRVDPAGTRTVVPQRYRDGKFISPLQVMGKATTLLRH